MKKFLVVAVVIGGAFYFLLRGGCGSDGALACPAPELEEGVGVRLSAREVCPNAGYLCAQRRSFQIARWPLTNGTLRVRVSLPGFVDKETAKMLREAAIEGIREWAGHPFPLIIDDAALMLRVPDVEVVWTEGLYNAAAGVATYSAQIDGKRLKYKSHGIAVVVPPLGAPSGPPAAGAAVYRGQQYTMGPLLLARIKATAMHEMGHALGLMHSDSRDDVMFPELRNDATYVRASARDLRTADALYALPNGATVQ